MQDRPPEPDAGDAAPKRRKAAALLALVGLLAYANAFNKGFVFDDAFWITNQPNIGNAGDYVWRSAARPLVAATLLLNHRLGGVQPVGYHAFNVAIHVASALVACSILARFFTLTSAPERLKRRGETLAFAVALLWVVHPLNTQAVTYVIQRAESLMGLFFLLGVYCWLRGGTGGRAWVWLPLALGSFVLSIAAKEVAIVWPLIILALDRIFLAGAWQPLLRKRWPAYAALAGLWAWLLYPTLVSSQSGRDFGIGFGLPITPAQYAFTETEVVLHYLRLAVWPSNLVGDYSGWPVAQSLKDVRPAAVVIAGIVLAMFAALYFRPKLGFPLLWALLILAPTSTVMPIIDVAFEHRMYLPLLGVLTLLVLTADALLARLPAGKVVGTGLLIVVVALLARQTVRRNEVYRSNASFFADALAKRPDNPRARGAVAEIKLFEGKLDEAGPMLEAVRNQQFHSRGFQLSVARWYTETGEAEKARAVYAGLEADPWPYAWRFWAAPYPRLLLGMGRPEEASRVALKLTQLSPNRAEAYALIAAAELAAGRRVEAQTAWDRAAALDANVGAGLHAEARRTILAALPTGGEPTERRRRVRQFRSELAYRLAASVTEFDGAIDPQRWDTLAMAAAATGRWPEALSAATTGQDLAERTGDAQWTAALRNRQSLYSDKRVYGPDE